MPRQGGNIHIGTSGWSYGHWQGPFYPPDLPAGKALDYYARQFGSVEINSSFYHLPQQQTLQHWREATPADFLFTAKASRYITHMKKLRDPVESVRIFLERISILGDKLGAILFQLPPHWRCNTTRLAAFIDALDSGIRYAFEFRDHSWMNPQTLKLLARNNAAFCIYDLDGFTTPLEITADFVYVRLHGPDGAYQGSYSDSALSAWADAFLDWQQQGHSVYCYFDNDQRGYAAVNARRLQQLLRQ
jgi:uncharacterized protein YecE (DUF72 family)